MEDQMSEKLNATWKLDSEEVKFGNCPCITGDHQVWTGTQWVAAKDLTPEDFARVLGDRAVIIDKELK
jgi:hypothetical protein